MAEPALPSAPSPATDDDSFDLLDVVQRIFLSTTAGPAELAAASMMVDNISGSSHTEAAEATAPTTTTTAAAPALLARTLRHTLSLSDVVRSIPSRVPHRDDEPESPGPRTGRGLMLRRHRTTRKLDPLPEVRKSFFHDSDDDVDEAEAEATKDNKAISIEKLFIQIGDDVKKTSFAATPPILFALRKLFEKKFNFKVAASETSEWNVFYIKDAGEDTFYELEDFGSIGEKATIKLKIAPTGEDDPRTRFTPAGSSFKRLLSEIGLIKNAVMSNSRDTEEQRKAAELLLTKQRDLAATKRRMQVDKFRQQILCLQDLKLQLNAIKQIHEAHVTDTESSIGVLKTNLNNHFSRDLPKLVELAATAATVHVDVERQRLNGERQAIELNAIKLREYIISLQQRTQQLADDLLKRRCRPSPATLSQVDEDMKEVEDLLTEHSARLNKEAKQAWKKQWEKELQLVVAEQKLMKEQEMLANDFEDDFAELTAALEALSKQLKQLDYAKPREFVAPDLPDDISEQDLRKSLLQQIAATKVDSEKRLKAATQADEQRRADIKLYVNPFEDELGKFVEQGCLRKTGGWQEADLARARRDAELLKGISSTTAATNSVDT